MLDHIMPLLLSSASLQRKTFTTTVHGAFPFPWIYNPPQFLQPSILLHSLYLHLTTKSCGSSWMSFRAFPDQTLDHFIERRYYHLQIIRCAITTKLPQYIYVLRLFLSTISCTSPNLIQKIPTFDPWPCFRAFSKFTHNGYDGRFFAWDSVKSPGTLLYENLYMETESSHSLGIQSCPNPLPTVNTSLQFSLERVKKKLSPGPMCPAPRSKKRSTNVRWRTLLPKNSNPYLSCRREKVLSRKYQLLNCHIPRATHLLKEDS